jgi:hypothetical protein
MPAMPLPLRTEDRDQIKAAREWVKAHFTVEAEERYEPIEGKLRVIETILERGWVDAGESWKLQALGVALGDAFAQKLMLDWVSVHLDYGYDAALNWPGTTIYCYPLTMISKRIERGDEVDVRKLFEATCTEMCEMAFSGQYL